MIDPNFITDMLGIFYWFFALFVIYWFLQEPFKVRRKRMKEKRANWREWWKNLSKLRRIYFCLTVIVTPLFIGSFLFIFPYFVIEIYNGMAPFSELALALFAILSALGALFGFYTSIINTETTEQGHITDRINKAIENLGKNDDGGYPLIEVRIGALYALERIAQDSIRDHIQIMEILCAYIRHNSPLPYKIDEEQIQPNNKSNRRKNEGEKIDEDIHAAIAIIGRRENWPEGNKRIKKERHKKYYIDLNRCNLHGVQLIKANLTNARLIGTDFSGARLLNTNLNNASLGRAVLVGTWLEDMKLSNTQFGDAVTERTWSYGGDFSNCRNLTQEQLDVMYFGIEVKIPKGLARPKHWPTEQLPFDKLQKLRYKWIGTIRQQ